MEYLGPAAKAHIDAWKLEDRYIYLHVAKRLPCNLKLAIEAFLEAYHVIETHPQVAVSNGDANSQYDIYGEHVFPLQVAFLLSVPGRDFTGGEFVLTEQRPRMQSRAEVVPLSQGDGVIFPVHHRPVKGSKGYYRVNMRHGVSRLRSGHRQTLGVIFHDAR